MPHGRTPPSIRRIAANHADFSQGIGPQQQKISALADFDAADVSLQPQQWEKHYCGRNRIE